MSKFKVGQTIQSLNHTGRWEVKSIVSSCKYRCDGCYGYAYQMSNGEEWCGRIDDDMVPLSHIHKPKQFKLPSHE